MHLPVCRCHSGHTTCDLADDALAAAAARVGRDTVQLRTDQISLRTPPPNWRAGRSNRTCSWASSLGRQEWFTSPRVQPAPLIVNRSPSPGANKPEPGISMYTLVGEGRG